MANSIRITVNNTKEWGLSEYYILNSVCPVCSTEYEQTILPGNFSMQTIEEIIYCFSCGVLYKVRFEEGDGD